MMNKSGLIKNLVSNTESFTKDDIESSIQKILNLISDSLAKADRVEIRNFGTFSIRTRERRISRDPKTGKSILVESKNHPYFRASKYLRESLNK